MGVISRSLAEGVAVGSKIGAAAKMGQTGMTTEASQTPYQKVATDAIDNADKFIKEEKNQKLELQDHHYPDAQNGDTVEAKMVHNDDGTRSLDTSIANSEDARQNLQDSISLNNQMTMGGGSDSSD